MQNAFSPAPANTTALTDFSSFACWKAWINSSTVCSRKAFITSGRLIVMRHGVFAQFVSDVSVSCHKGSV